jgi:hypothetical protein
MPVDLFALNTAHPPVSPPPPFSFERRGRRVSRVFGGEYFLNFQKGNFKGVPLFKMG